MYTIKRTGKMNAKADGYMGNRAGYSSLKEAKEIIYKLMKAHATFDIYKDGKLFATGDDTGLYKVRA